MPRVLLLLIAAVIALGAADDARARAKAELAEVSKEALRLSRAFNLIHELAAPTVVSIHTREQYRLINRWELREEVREVEVGEGSGFLFASDDKASYVLTNAHVVAQTNGKQEFIRGAKGQPVAYDKIAVVTNDNRSYDAELVGLDLQTDLAVLRIPVGKRPTVEWANSDQARVGDWVVAEGFPFGKGYSATSGIISATDRSTGIYSGVRGFESFIQTDAAINPGNSGGPLFNLEGKVVGVNANIISPTGVNAGLGFAIPANLARRVAEDLMDDGKVTRPMVGVEIKELSTDDALAMGVPGLHTLQIRSVVPGSPAESGGVRPGDVLLAIDTLSIQSWQQFRARIASARIGDNLEFSLWREGKEVKATIATVASDQLAVKVGERLRQGAHLGEFGLLLGDDDDKPGLAVLHVQPESLADQAGISAGDRVLHERVLGALHKLTDLDALAERKEVILQVLKDGRSVWVRLRR